MLGRGQKRFQHVQHSKIHLPDLDGQHEGQTGLSQGTVSIFLLSARLNSGHYVIERRKNEIFIVKRNRFFILR